MEMVDEHEDDDDVKEALEEVRKEIAQDQTNVVADISRHARKTMMLIERLHFLTTLKRFSISLGGIFLFIGIMGFLLVALIYGGHIDMFVNKGVESLVTSIVALVSVIQVLGGLALIAK